VCYSTQKKNKCYLATKLSIFFLGNKLTRCFLMDFGRWANMCIHDFCFHYPSNIFFGLARYLVIVQLLNLTNLISLICAIQWPRWLHKVPPLQSSWTSWKSKKNQVDQYQCYRRNEAHVACWKYSLALITYIICWILLYIHVMSTYWYYQNDPKVKLNLNVPGIPCGAKK
jgi:hypothetical protein